MHRRIIYAFSGTALLLGLGAATLSGSASLGHVAGKPMDEVEFDGMLTRGEPIDEGAFDRMPAHPDAAADLERISGTDRSARSRFGPMTEKARHDTADSADRRQAMRA